MSVGPLNLAPNVALVTVAVVRATLGGSADHVIELIEGGHLRHTFDLSIGAGKTRCLRVWRGSLVALQRRQEDRTPFSAVIADCIGLANRARLRGQELADRWMLSRPSVYLILKRGFVAGSIEDHQLWLEAGSLREFLEKRAVGGKAVESFIGRRSPDPHQAPSRASRGQKPLCMELQEAYPPTGPEITQPRLKR